MYNLKNCSVCKGNGILVENYSGRSAYFCQCESCGKVTNEFSDSNTAADAWNASEPSVPLVNFENQKRCSCLMKPGSTWWSYFFRLLILVYFPMNGLFSIPGSDIGVIFPTIVIIVIFLGIGIPLFIRFDKKKKRVMACLTDFNLQANWRARTTAFWTAPLAISFIWTMQIIQFMYTH